MKRYILALGLLCLSGSVTFAREETMLARVTVYWASGGSGSDAWTRQHIAASGARLRAGHCAVDPHLIPYGSKVVVGDTTCVAVDTGKHVVSRRAARKAGRTPTERNAIVIDRFFETKGQALAWASRNPHFMTVRILSPNEQSPGAIARGSSSSSATPKFVAINSVVTRPGIQISPSRTAPTQPIISRPPLQPAVISWRTGTRAPKPKPVFEPPQLPSEQSRHLAALSLSTRPVAYLP